MGLLRLFLILRRRHGDLLVTAGLFLGTTFLMLAVESLLRLGLSFYSRIPLPSPLWARAFWRNFCEAWSLSRARAEQ